MQQTLEMLVDSSSNRSWLFSDSWCNKVTFKFLLAIIYAILFPFNSIIGAIQPLNLFVQLYTVLMVLRR